MASTITTNQKDEEQANIPSNISEEDRNQFGSKLAVSVSKLEDEMNRILDDFDRMDASIDQMLNIAEEEESGDEIFDCGATSGVASHTSKIWSPQGKSPRKFL